MVASALEAEQVKNRDIWKDLYNLGATEHAGLKKPHRECSKMSRLQCREYSLIGALKMAEIRYRGGQFAKVI